MKRNMALGPDRCVSLVALLMGTWWTGTTTAQTTRDTAQSAAEQRRAEERDTRQRAQAVPAPNARTDGPEATPAPRLPVDESPCFHIQQIELRGAAAQQFAWVLDALNASDGLDGPLRRCLGAAGIGVLLQRAQHAMVARGFVTSRVMVEPQDLQSGRLSLKPGTVVLSEPVNLRLPGLMNMVAAMATQGEAAPPDMDNADSTGAQPVYRLSLAQTQEGLDPVYLSYARRASLAPEELLHAATGALGILAAKSRPVLGLSLARYISHYCMLEAAKTAGRRPQMSDFSEAHLRPLASLLPPRSLLQRLSGWLDRSAIRNYLHASHK